MNPAVGIGVTAMGSDISKLWLYMVGPLAGGAAAAAVFKIQNPEMQGVEMAKTLSRQLGKEISDQAMRQTLHRARAQFADLLLQEVCRTLGTPDAGELTR